MSEGAAKKEEKPLKFQAIRGTRDLLPPDTALLNRVEQTAREVFATYGFGEIRLPNFELARLFERGVGDETDIVTKELYSWIDSPLANQALRRVRAKAIQNAYRAIHDDETVREELLRQASAGAFDTLAKANRICLRPEATASVCRAYIEHEMQALPQPVKLYYMGPMFRRERPQKGRYRQFYQIGAEVLEAVRPDVFELFKPGVQRDSRAAKELAKDATIDAEVIEMLMTFFNRVGLQGTELSVNSIGHAADNCRRAYVAELRAVLNAGKDVLGEDSKRRIETNPLRILDSKVDKEQALIWTLPRIADHLCDDCKMHYAALKRELDLRGVKYRENWRLVRGLDYYMRTTFEITAKGLGSQDAVCGGGRYDGLVELLGGPPTKGIGFAIGEDRVVLSLVHDKPLAQRRDIDIVLAWLSPETYTKAVELAQNLRTEGVKVDLPTKLMRAGDAVRYADRIGAYFTLLLGEDELKSGQLTLKHMLRQEQMKITETELLSHLKHQDELREGQTKK